MARAHTDQKSKEALLKWKSLVEKIVIADMWIKSVPKFTTTRRPTENKELSEITKETKRVINIPLELRTVNERKDLAAFFGVMGCLTNITPKIRSRMSRFAKYGEFQMGHPIIVEGSEPAYVYFIMAGKIETSNQVYNKELKREVKKRDLVNVFGAGVCIGFQAILSNSFREYTFTAITDVEAIYMDVKDYRKYVLPFARAKWFEKEKAIRAVPYFKEFTDQQILEANKLSVLKQWGMYDHIYSKDGGELSNVYFVLSGECMIVQVLRVEVKNTTGEGEYVLAPIEKKKVGSSSQSSSDDDLETAKYIEPHFTEEDIEEALKEADVKNKFGIKAALAKCGMPIPPSVLRVEEQPYKQEEKFKRAIYGVFYRGLNVSRSVDSLTYNEDINIQIVRTLMKPSKSRKRDKDILKKLVVEDLIEKIKLMTKTEQMELKAAEAAKRKEEKKRLKEEQRALDRLLYVEGEEWSPRQFSTTTSSSSGTGKGITKAIELADSTIAIKVPELPLPDSLSDSLDSLAVSDPTSSDSSLDVSASSKSSFDDEDEDDDDVSPTESVGDISMYDEDRVIEYETHIIDVGVIKENGIFGLGEKLEERYILARTSVQCLLLPRFWLLQREQNPSKVWQARLQILQMSIPSREKVFQIFLEEQKWPVIKKKFVEDAIANNVKYGKTKEQDLPTMLFL